MSEALAVVSVGACCSVGLSAAETSVSLRAGVTRKSESLLADRALAPVVLGHLDDRLLPPLRSTLRRETSPLTARMLRLAGLPLREVLTGPFAGARLPLQLAAPAMPGLLSPEFLAALAVQAELPLALPHSRLHPGQAGLFAAIAAVTADPGSELVIVGGVDSYYDRERIRALEREDRLRTSGPQDAFTPGEAAAFVMLARAEACRRYALTPLAWITHSRLVDDPVAADGFEALARGVTSLFEAAAPGGARLGIRSVFAGLNGESKSAREWGIAQVRNTEHFVPGFALEHPAEAIGDAGAALAPLMLAVAALQLRQAKLAGPTLIWAGGEGSQRGALILYPHR
ncbi:MAG: hypothetical protein R6X02_10100 [Enhygromyxa sp.]